MAVIGDVAGLEAVQSGTLTEMRHMTRTTVVTLTDEAKELKIEDESLRELSGKEVVTGSFTTEHLENVLFVAPAEGPAELIGAEEILLRAEGS